MQRTFRLFNWLAALLLLTSLQLLWPTTAGADALVVTDFPTTGFFTAKFKGDNNNVAVMEMLGNYDMLLKTGAPNGEPRTVAAKEFYRTHPDKYDFLIVFTSFDFDTSNPNADTKNAEAFHIAVQNHVKGLGLKDFDYTQQFGSSNGTLLAYVDMAALTRYNLNPFDPKFENVLATLAHEILHQWEASVHVLGPDGKPSDVLLGPDKSHWSFLLDTGASVEYGNQWQDNGDGTFTSVSARQFYSPLDLYLMGMYKKEEVPPFFYIETTDAQANQFPQTGVTVHGTKHMVSVDDIIAAEGPRVPSAADSKKEFRLGYVLLTRSGETATDAQIASINEVRKAFQTRLSIMTAGRAIAHTTLEPLAAAATPSNPTTSTPSGSANADLVNGLKWLGNAQGKYGSWQDNPFTSVRDTTVAIDTLSNNAGGVFSGYLLARDWLSAQTLGNADYLARRALSLNGQSQAVTDIAALLLAQNADGGWGAASGYLSNPLDTALTMQALQRGGGSTSTVASLGKAEAYLLATQNPDGGWGDASSGASRILPTTAVVNALQTKPSLASIKAKVLAFLAQRQNGDGGFGEGSTSTVHDTANVLIALSAVQGLDGIRQQDALKYVNGSQRADGSWDGSTYSTALALRVLKSGALVNWNVSNLTATPASATDGRYVQLSVTVSNTGSVGAGTGLLRFYDGGQNGVQIGSDVSVPPLSPGQSVTLLTNWNTFNKAGSHALAAVVDPLGATVETSKADNTASLNFVVNPASLKTDLSISATDIAVTPAKLGTLPAPVGISALVSNIGQTDATNVKVALYEGIGSQATPIAQTTLNLLGRATQVVNFSPVKKTPGDTVYTIVLDPDQTSGDVDRSNNSASVTVSTTSSLDVAVSASDITLANTLYVGSDASFKIKLVNQGTIDSSPFHVHYSVTDGTQVIDVADRTLQIAAGQSVSQDLAWKAVSSGNWTLKVELDRENLLADADRSNNVATFPFVVSDATGVNLAVSYRDLTFDSNPTLEGHDVGIHAVVSNTGSVAATNVQVQFYDGDPTAGGTPIGAVQTIAQLNPAQSATVSLTWPHLLGARTRLVYVVVDPAQQITEITRADNSAFNTLTVTPLPDLAIAAGNISLTPDNPKPGDPVVISALVSNLGGQAANAVVVRAYDGDPAVGGTLIGSNTVPTIAPQATLQTSFNWAPASTLAAHTLFVVVDPDNQIEESDKTNNSASRSTVIQSGKTFITEPYFSPNGDGIKDTTTFSFRTDAPTDVTVQVLDAKNRVVRTYAGAELKQTLAGSFEWNGLDDLGRLQKDGVYKIRAVNPSGTSLGDVSVTLDNNHSPILAASGTPYETYRNLTCELPEIQNVQFAGDEQHLYFSTSETALTASYPKSIYQMLANGTNIKPVISPAMFANDANVTNLSVATNNDQIAFVRTNYYDAHNTFINQVEVWTAAGDGSKTRLLMSNQAKAPAGTNIATYANITMQQMLADGSAVVVETQQGDAQQLLRLPVDGSAPTQLIGTTGYSLQRVLIAPNRQRALLRLYQNNKWDWMVIDLLSGERHSIPTAQLGTDFDYDQIRWSLDSSRFFLGGVRRKWVNGTNVSTALFNAFDADFNLLKGFQADLTNATNGECGECGYGGNILASEWNGTSDGFIFASGASTGGPAAASVMSTTSSGGSSKTTIYAADLITGALNQIAAPAAIPANNFDLWADPFSSLELIVCNQGIPCLYSADTDGYAYMPVLGSWYAANPAAADPSNGTQLNFSNTADMTSTGRPFLPSGRSLLFQAPRLFAANADSCYPRSNNWSNDIWSYSSLLNLTADLRAMYVGAGKGILLRGSAADQNFARYTLEYASSATPTDWHSVAPSSTQPIVDGVFTTWVPPAFGNYIVRLTVEDLAGNQKRAQQSIAYDDTPLITDLYKDFDYISPNGDGVQDQLQLHYRVLQPVHLEFTVSDAKGNLVRTFSRDHSLIGQEFQLVWDGRDASGRVVDDGQYKLSVLGYDFLVTVDNTPPVANLTFINAYPGMFSPPDLAVATSGPTLVWSYQDSNFFSAKLQSADLNTSDWTDLPSSVLQAKGAQGLGVGDIVGKQFRLVVTDKAGNQTSTGVLTTEQLFLFSFTEVPVAVGGTKPTPPPVWAAPYIRQADTVGSLPLLDTLTGAAPIRFDYIESIKAPLQQVFVQYLDVTDNDGMPVSALDSQQWTEKPIAQFLDSFGKSVGNKPVDGLVSFLFDPANLLPQHKYLVRIKAVTDSGQAQLALYPYAVKFNDYLVILPDPFTGKVLVGDALAGYRATGAGAHHDGYAKVEVTLQSLVDQRFATPSTVGTVIAPDVQFGVNLDRWVNLAPCVDYNVQLVGTPNMPTDGRARAPLILSAPGVYTSACIDVNWRVRPEFAQACNQAPSGKDTITLHPKTYAGNKLVHLVFGRHRADGTDDILANWTDPADNVDVSYTLDTNGMQEGPQSGYFTRATDSAGHTSEATVSFTVSRQAPVAKITYPSAGAKVCGVKVTDPFGIKRNVVSVQGEMSDTAGMYYSLEYSSKNTPDNWIKINPAAVPFDDDIAGPTGAMGNATRMAVDTNPLCRYAPSDLCRDYHPVQWASDAKNNFPGVTQYAGSAGMLGLLEDKLNPDLNLRLKVYGTSGAMSCTDAMPINFDNFVDYQYGAIDHGLFTTNADGTAVNSTLTITVGEPLNATLEIYPAYYDDNHNLNLVDGASPVRTLANALPVFAGDSSYTWDGHDDSGQIAKDGVYAFRLRLSDGCVNELEKLFAVELDNTPPVVSVSDLMPGSLIGLEVRVNGLATDAHFASYSVQFATDSSPDVWLPINAGNKQVTPAGKLADWNTFGLNGGVTLRVQAADSVGNKTDVRIPLKVGDQKLIDAVSATPDPFSPNGDGRRDTVAIRYNLLQAVSGTIDILAPGGAKVRTLVSGVTMALGAGTQVWDGKNAQGQVQPDGIYTAHLTATSLDGVQTQTADAQFMLAATPPAITLLNPASAYITGKGMLTARINDAIPNTYSAYLNSGTSNTATQLVNSGAYDSTPLQITDLSLLPEGPYTLRITATDVAENSSELVKNFEIDRTPPKVSVTTPTEGAYLSARNGPIAIAGSVVEKNLASYALGIVVGNSSQQLPLLSGTSLPQPAITTSWDISKLADGAYQVALHADDLALQSGDAHVNVIVDNTPPVVAIRVPATGSYVRMPSDILGTAKDANFSSYTIDVAPGTQATATRWTTIGSGATAVDDGTLLKWQALPPDGPQTLRLTAVDKAGNVSVAYAEVIIDTVPPAAPINLAVTLANRHDAKLSWNANQEPDLAGYAIYRDGTRINTDLITDIHYLDPSLLAGPHAYTVTAFDKAGWESAPSNKVTVVVSTAQLVAKIFTPTNGKVVSNLLDIQGSANSGSDFKEYRVSIAPAGSTSWQLIRRSPVATVADSLANWDTTTLPQGATFQIKLEAEALDGSTASDVVSVSIDNVAPNAPLNLQAAATDANVALQWTANQEPDLAGYLLYRDGHLANAIGAVVGDLTPYLLVPNTYSDLNVADGVHAYTVFAVDKAGNTSPPSNVATVTVDTRPPHATIVQPTDGQKVGSNTYLLATSPDTDVAQVLFQYRPAAGGAWTNIGAPVTKAPWGIYWNPTGLPFGSYEFQAIATDLTSHVDPAPTSIHLTYTNLVPPDQLTLAAAVNGGDVTLSWPASTSPYLAGYVLKRLNPDGSSTVLNSTPITAVSYVDASLNDATYQYSVVAVDQQGNVSKDSPLASAIVYTPTLEQPFTPTVAANTALKGTGLPARHVQISTSTAVIANGDADAATGAFTVQVPLAAGDNRLTLRERDDNGNLSKAVAFHVLQVTRPAAPAGLAANVTGSTVALTWQANTEADLLGYYLAADQATPTIDPLDMSTVTGTVSSSQQYYDSTQGAWLFMPASFAFDNNTSTEWQPSPSQPVSGQWLALKLKQPAVIDNVTFGWDGTYVARDFNIDAYDGEVWVPVAKVRGNADVFQQVTLAQRYRTDQLRITLLASNACDGCTVGISEVKVGTLHTQTDPSYSATFNDGQHQLNVYAINTSAYESTPSTVPAAVGDTSVPAPVVLAASVNQSDVTLTWLASTSTNVAKYEVDRDGVKIGEVTDLTALTYLDPALPNGSYHYVVKPVGTDQLIGAASNDVVATIAVAGPPTTITLSALAPATGGEVDLSWLLGTGAVPNTYIVHRATQAGGPYVTLNGAWTSTQYVDHTVVNGTKYFYVVQSADAQGHLGSLSNEVSATPRDTVAPVTPVFISPTVAGSPISTRVPNADVLGMAEPGSTVTLTQGGATAGTTVAAADTLVKQLPMTNLNNWALSPDGRWLVNGNNPQLIDRYTAQSQSIPGVANANTSLFAPDGSSMLFIGSADGNNGNQLLYWDRTTAAAKVLNSVSMYGSGLAYAPDGRHAVVLNYVPGDTTYGGLYLVNLTSNVATPLVKAYPWSFGYQLSWSGDGKYLAFMQSNQLKVVDASSGNVSTVNEPGSPNSLMWSRDSSALYYTAQDPNPPYLNQIHRYTPQSGVVDALTNVQSNGYQYMALSPDGTSLAAVHDDYTLVRRSLTTGAEETLLGNDGRGKYSLSWMASGLMFYSNGSGITQVTPKGTFAFMQQRLANGNNQFGAYSTDAAGNRSPNAQPISVTLLTDALPDLVVAASDLTVIPASPMVGEPVRIAVQVRNVGAAAPATDLQVVLRDPQGQLTSLLAQAVPALAQNGSQTYLIDWKAPATGTYTLVATVDASNTVIEADETNNTASVSINVVDNALPTITVATDATHYAPGAQVAGTASLSNAGAAFTGTVRAHVEDAGGYLVQALPDQPVQNLAYASALTLNEPWDSTGIVAGDYVLVADLLDVNQVNIGTSRTRFTLDAVQQAQLSVSTDKASYGANEAVNATGTVQLSTNSTSAQNQTLRLRVVSPQGTTVAQAEQGGVTLLPGVAASEPLTFNTGALPPGTYTVVLEEQDATSGALQQAQTTFDIVASAVPNLGGTLTLDNAAPAIGSGFNAQLAVRNTGNVDLTGIPVSARVVDTSTGTELANVPAQASATVGTSWTGSAHFDTTGWPLKSLQVTLEATVSGQRVVLDRQTVKVIDNVPPVVSFVQPAAGAYVSGNPLAIVVSATDLNSRVVSTELSLDGQTWQKIAVQNIVQSTYVYNLVAADGPRTVYARATDTYNNVSAPVALSFILDNTPPTITVTGVTAGTTYTSGVTPVIAVADANLQGSTITLNGQPFTSGTPVPADGSYVLNVTATDKAGNTANSNITFVIAHTPPTVQIQLPLDGAIVRTPVMLQAAASGAQPVTKVEYQLDSDTTWTAMTAGTGGQYSISLTGQADGLHSAKVRATDNLGLVSTMPSVSWTVDNTPPAITVTGVAAGITYATTVTPVIAVADANLQSSTITLNGAAYVSGTPVTADGSYSLVVNAADKAGNTASSTVAFTIMHTPPTVAIQAPAAASFSRTPVVLQATASGAQTIAAVEYQLDADSTWTAMTAGTGGQYSASLTGLADGSHTAKVRATDSLGLVSTIPSVTWVVDNTAPVITVTGVTAGTTYSGSVTPAITVTDANLQSSTITLNGAAFVSGTAVTADGSYTLVVNATDKAGNTASSSVAFTITHTPPTATIVAPTAGLIAKTPISLIATASSAQTIAKVEYQLDSGTTWTAMTLAGSQYTASLTGLSDGSHTANVRATDSLGLVSAIPSVTWIVDNTAPVITVTGVTAGTTYTGTVTPSISVTDANLQGSTVTLNGAAYTSGTPVTADGSYTLVITGTDKAGNTATSNVAFVIAHTGPTATIQNPVNGVVAKTPITLQATASGNQAISKVEYQLDSTTTWTAMTAGTGSQYTASLTGLADGSHTVKVRATDSLNLVSANSSVTWVVDNTAPVITVTGVTAGTTYSTTVTPVIAVADANLQSSTTTLNGAAYVSGTAVTADGSYSLVVNATDKAGNTASSTVAFTITHSAPTVTIQAPTAGAFTRTPLTLQATATGAQTIAKVEYQLDSTTTWTAMTAGTGGQYTASLSGLADGSHTAKVRATDSLGLVSAVPSVTWTVDNTAPTITVTGVVDGNSYAATVTPVITVADANLQSSTITLNGAAYVSGTAVSANGSYSLVINATDKAGNTASKTVGFTIAHAVPTVSIQTPAVGLIAKTPITLLATASGTQTIAKVEYQLDSTTTWTAMTAGTAGQYSASLTGLADGSHTVKVRATDSLGLVSAIPSNTWVVDNTAPVITVTGVTAGSTYSISATPVITIADANLLDSTVTLDGNAYTSGTAVTTAGAHTLVIYAADRAGNTSRTSVAFTVQALNISGTLTAIPLQVPAGESTVFSVTIKNNGDDICQPGQTTSATITTQLLVRNPTTHAVIKEFDDSFTLAAGSQRNKSYTWTPPGAAGTTYELVWQATVNGTTVTLATSTLTVISAEPQVKLSAQASIDARSRVLVWLSCQKDWWVSANTSPLLTNQPCFTQRAGQIDAWLNTRGVPHQIVLDETSFTRALRTGQYNQYWLLGAIDAIKGSVGDELREMVYRGNTAVFDGNVTTWHDQSLFDIVGAKYTGRFVKPNQTVSINGAPLPTATLAGAGQPIRLQAQGGQVLATVPGTGAVEDVQSGQTGVTPYPAIVSQGYGRGKATLFGFDLVDSLNANATAWGSQLDAALGAMPGTLPSLYVLDDPIPVDLKLTNQGPVTKLDVVSTWPKNSAAWFAESNGASSDSGVEWGNVAFGDKQVLDLRLGYFAPSPEGAQRLDTSIADFYKNAWHPYTNVPLNYQVAGLETLVTSANNALTLLNPSSSANKTLVSQAIASLQSAAQSMRQGQYCTGLEQALTGIGALRSTSSLDIASSRWALDDLLHFAMLHCNECDPHVFARRAALTVKDQAVLVHNSTIAADPDFGEELEMTPVLVGGSASGADLYHQVTSTGYELLGKHVLYGDKALVAQAADVAKDGDRFFLEYFGQTKAQVKQGAYVIHGANFVSEVNSGHLNGSKGHVVWVVGDVTVNTPLANVGFSLPLVPGVAIIVEGNFTLNAGMDMFGVLYGIAPAQGTWNATLNAPLKVNGVMAVEGSMSLNGAIHVVPDDEYYESLIRKDASRGGE
ncbi:CARDB domain-containing protein [Andreprevotia chitinilytica]|uniref:CARDB domain-containing protein n=1 Tax=Andreprevotia chitinilytica TaxID=396808 RepID=UPI000558122D|nr:CARDB domain-containing protein [Andreprevotia chitinilytica]